MPTKETMENIADTIDSLINADFSAGGVIRKLYTHARAREGRSPTLVAAEKLNSVLTERGKIVLILTGAVMGTALRGVPLFVGETDGPPGAVALARILTQLRVVPVLVTDEEAVNSISAQACAAGLYVTDFKTAKENVLEAEVGTTAVVQGFPKDDKKALTVSRDMVKKLKPAAVVAIEKMGPNERGMVWSASLGKRLPDQIRLDYLIEEARKHGAVAIGIGDRGNEMGMARIKEGITKDIPFGKDLPASVETDVVVTSTVSNWGAYGVAACLLALLNKPEFLYSAELESKVLEKAVETGCIDGVTGFAEPSVDGLPAYVNASVVQLIAYTVRKGLAGWLAKV